MSTAIIENIPTVTPSSERIVRIKFIFNADQANLKLSIINFINNITLVCLALSVNFQNNSLSLPAIFEAALTAIILHKNKL